MERFFMRIAEIGALQGLFFDIVFMTRSEAWKKEVYVQAKPLHKKK